MIYTYYNRSKSSVWLKIIFYTYDTPSDQRRYVGYFTEIVFDIDFGCINILSKKNHLRLIYDSIDDNPYSNFDWFCECVHSPLTDSHLSDAISRRQKMAFEVRRREYGISEWVSGIFFVHGTSTDGVYHVYVCSWFTKLFCTILLY